MMKKASGEEPKMWGSSLIGFGNVRLKSPATGREVDWLRIGFSPRKANLSLYLTGDIVNGWRRRFLASAIILIVHSIAAIGAVTMYRWW